MAKQLIKSQTFFATCAKGLVELLGEELQRLGATQIKLRAAGVSFYGDLALAYKICLWSRLASRVLFPIATFPAENPQALYIGVGQIDWELHLACDNTLAVDFTTIDSQIIHTQFGAQKVKDAIVDQFRARFNERPSVELIQPDVRINVHVQADVATVSIDLSGESLHKRHYREYGGEAPLKENLAAALLIRAGWEQIAAAGGTLVDLMCGSATLPIEAALIAGNIAPGLLRDYFGFLKWRGHDKKIWENLLQEANSVKREITSTFIGYDADPARIREGIQHVTKLALQHVIHLERRELAQVVTLQQWQKHPGLVIVNPPYGERLGEASELMYLYQRLGEVFRKHFLQWRGAIFTGNPELGKTMGLRAKKMYVFFNGAIPCKLLLFDVTEEYFVKTRSTVTKEIAAAPTVPRNDERHPSLQMFMDRVQKNNKHLQRWAEREHISCYRVYDADLPDYAIAIDRYSHCLHVQEYAPPKTIDPVKAQERLDNAVSVLPEIFGVNPENIFVKVKRRQKPSEQHRKLDQLERMLEIKEDEAKLLVNLSDYVDTGLFLDQRMTRAMIKKNVKGKHFLNLFCYTGSATVYAAIGGAASTTSVDMSAPYLQWAKKNMALNGFSEHRHHFIQADCVEWMKEEKRQYDVIYLEPPTFSNSKRMQEAFELERDQWELLSQAHRLLAPGGKLYFATNKHNFHLDLKVNALFKIRDLSKLTLPLDFKRRQAYHHCYLLEK